ncbi:transcriptional regulator [Catenovulum agarivorans DS-2]|uniref:Transcriptional regulator n=1 Tax=Catenovulum agarivorans DS-2 TaxID=1328313 RepID=W7QEG7_9ALTE|nr:TetR/AcrR family transcriptional regulator [Catenovulum agarivorans]EWH10311.1 transcriptional regulator [Catenovulum agarivorans DS-2]
MGCWLKRLRDKYQRDCQAVDKLCPRSKAEKIQQREQELLQLAHQLVHEVGLNNVTMEKLVSASPYSKGTIYNHFCSKEDLFVALGVHSMGLCAELMHKAHQFSGSSRERALAVHFAYHLYGLLEPALFMCVLNCKTANVQQKASKARLAQLDKADEDIAQLCDSFFTQGIEDGSLTLEKSQIAAVSFANWACSFGTNLLLQNAASIYAISRLGAANKVLFNVNLVFDGMGWQPLSKDYDYKMSWQKIEQHFADYVEMLN